MNILYVLYVYGCMEWIINFLLPQLFIVGFNMMTKRTSETLAALASFLNILNWPENYSFPDYNKGYIDSDGVSCADRDRLVSDSGRLFGL